MTSLIWGLHPGTFLPIDLRAASNVWPSASTPACPLECECCAVPPVFLMFWLTLGLSCHYKQVCHWIVAETSYYHQTCFAYHANVPRVLYPLFFEVSTSALLAVTIVFLCKAISVWLLLDGHCKHHLKWNLPSVHFYSPQHWKHAKANCCESYAYLEYPYWTGEWNPKRIIKSGSDLLSRVKKGKFLTGSYNADALLPNKRISFISAMFCLAQHFLQAYKPQEKKKEKVDATAENQLKEFWNVTCAF